MLRFGPSVKKTGNYVPVPKSHELCQFFPGENSSDLKWDPFKHPDYPTDFTYYVHAPFRLNLGYDGRNYVTPILTKLLNEVKDTPGSVVVHFGMRKNLDKTKKEKVILEIAERINKTKIPDSQNERTLLIENAAGETSELGDTVEDFRSLFEKLDYTARIGVCVDTQHSFAAGLTDFSDSSSVANLFEMFHDFGGIRLIHLNDSTVGCHGCCDEHMPLGQGKIWKKNTESLVELCFRCSSEEVDLISETHDYEGDLQLLTKLLEKENLF